MSDSKNIADATPENFAELVIGNSMRGPVMVNFWSAKAGPCIKLWPLLEKLVNEYSGKFLLVNLNTDQHREFAQRELGVTSVPTVKLFHQQQVVDVIHGAESEKSFRAMINRHLPRQSDALLLDAVKQYQENKIDDAFAQLKKLQQSDYDNPRIPLTLIKLMFREGRFDDMLKYVASLPSALKKHEDVISLVTHAGFIQAAQNAADVQQLEQQVKNQADDLDLRYQLSAVYLINDLYQQAMDQLLEIIKRDRKYRDDIGVKGMVSILNLIAQQPELVKSYRNKMIDAMSG